MDGGVRGRGGGKRGRKRVSCAVMAFARCVYGCRKNVEGFSERKKYKEWLFMYIRHHPSGHLPLGVYTCDHGRLILYTYTLHPLSVGVRRPSSTLNDTLWMRILYKYTCTIYIYLYICMYTTRPEGQGDVDVEAEGVGVYSHIYI